VFHDNDQRPYLVEIYSINLHGLTGNYCSLRGLRAMDLRNRVHKLVASYLVCTTLRISILRSVINVKRGLSVYENKTHSVINIA
jgi:hypothetical protein